MPDAPTAPQPVRPQAVSAESNRVNELRVSGNLMTLDTGLYCILNKPSPVADAGSGLPGVRLSLPPGTRSRREMVEISTFSADGWLTGFGDAALVRVHSGPAHLLVTIYQSPSHPEGAPNIQVVKLLDGAAPRADAERAAPVAEPAPVPAPVPAATSTDGPRVMDMVAHIQGLGDVGALLGERLGEVGSKRWIEGFAIAPTHDVAPSEIEYQAVLGRGWLSPWVEGGEFCGSRGMALPVLGLRVRLRGEAARTYDCTYSASFTDGAQAGPVPAGASCEADSLAPLESFQVVISRRGQAPMPEPVVVELPSVAEEAPVVEAPKAKAPAAKKPAAKPAGRATPAPRRR